MKKLLFVMLATVLLASCAKNKTVTENGYFLYKGAVYETLQEAVDAATIKETDEITDEIGLVGNAVGDGAVVDASYSGFVRINFGSNIYTLNNGKCIDAGSSLCEIVGEGGTLSGNGTIIKARDGVVEFYGNLDLRGDLDLVSNEDDTQSSCFTRDFNGSFIGNVTLSEAMLVLRSDNARVHIQQLEAVGKTSAVEVDCTPKEKVKIMRVHAQYPNPVRTTPTGASVIDADCDIHYHVFSNVEHHEATCVSLPYDEMTCSCGFVRIQQTGEEYGRCPEQYIRHYSEPDDPVEIYACALCGRKYHDHEGLQPYEEFKLYDSYASLFDLDSELDWRNEFIQTKDAIAIAGLVLTIVGLVETLGLSLPSLVADDSDKWAEVNTKLDQIKTSLDRIEQKIDRLAAKIDAITYKQVAIGRNEKFNYLKTKSIPVFQLINGYLKDSLITKDEKVEKIKLTLKDWSTGQFQGTQIADLTQSLMQQYPNIGTGESVPAAFEAIANVSYMWEHEGYNFRYQAAVQDVVLSSISYMMSCYYISSVKEYGNEDLRKIDLENFKKDFDKYSAMVKAELEKIRTRDESYRYFNSLNICFDRKGKNVNFRRWFETHRSKQFPRNNDDGRATASCDAMLRDLGLYGRMKFTTDIAREIYSHYNRNNGNNPVGMYKILTDSVGFKNLPASFDPGVIFTYRSNGFDHVGGDTSEPTYRIFQWRSLRSSSGNDMFGIRTGLSEKCNEENHNVLFYCDINSRAAGTINDLGQETRWDWYTIVTAN